MNTPKGLLPFDLEAALKGESVCTRGGKEVKQIVHFDTSEVAYPVYGVLYGGVHKWNLHGYHLSETDPSVDDLFMAPKPVVVYTNVFESGVSGQYNGVEQAQKYNQAQSALSVCRLSILNGEVVKAETVHRY